MTNSADSLAFSLVTPDKPWPGLAAFDESSTDYFFGRDADGDELLRMVKRETLSVLFGQSGLGKTSLLQAWLFPHLRREDCLPVLVRLVHTEDAPALVDQIKSAVAAEIVLAHVDAPKPQSGQTLWEYFHHKAADFWSSRQRLLTPVIILDQFEELFTLGRSSDANRARGQALVAELADLIENRPPDVLKVRLESGDAQSAAYNFDPAAFRVVITLRADFLPELESLSAAIPSIQFNRMPLLPLNGLQAREAVTKPGMGLVDADVALKIVQFVAGSDAPSPADDQLKAMRVEPALLSIICRELNERRLARKLPKITADLVAGDRAEILSDFYERSLAGTPEEVRLWVEDRLLTVSGYRNSQDLDDALVRLGRANLDTLVARRLLRIDDRFGTQRVELTHDVLAAPVRASRDERQQREELAEATKRFKEIRRQLRVARRRTAGVMVLVLVSLGFGLFTYRQWYKAAESEAKADDATKHAQDALRTAQDRLVTSLSYEGNYLLLTHRIAEARQALYQGMRLQPQTSIPWLWIAAPLLDSNARFESPVSVASSFNGHTNRITSIAVSPDGTRVISGSSDMSLKLWDVGTGNEIRSFKGHSASVISVAFSPDGRKVLSGSSDKTLKLWDVETGKEIQPAFTGHSDRTKGVFSPDGKFALSASEDTTLKLWEIATRKEIRTFKGHAGPVQCAVFSPDGRAALSGSADRTLILWDVAAGTVIRSFAGHTATIRGVAISHDGKTALSGGDDLTIKLWDLATGKLIRDFQGNFDPGSGRTGAAHSEQVWSVAFAPDDRTALSGGDDKIVKLWDVATGREIRSFVGHTDWVTQLAFSPGGRMALSASFDKTLKLWDLTATEVHTFTGHGDQVRRLAIAPGGSMALTVSNDKTVRLLDVATMKEIQIFKGHTAPVLSMAFAPDGRTAISASEDRTLRLWDLATGKELRKPLQGHTGWVWSVAFLPDGQSVLSASADKTLRLWDVKTGKEVRRFSPRHTDEVFCVAVSPDGRTALSGSRDKSMNLWDVQTGKFIREFKGHLGWVINVTFSSDGKLALSGSGDKTLKLWDVATGKLIRTFNGHSDSVLGVAFSPDGHTALSGSMDKTVKLWDLESGKEIQTFTGHSDVVRSVSFTPDGLEALSASNDKTVKLWDFSRPKLRLEFEEKLPAACATLTKNSKDAAALGLLGRWYAFRGSDKLAVQFLEHARQVGGHVSPLVLGRCYWDLSRYKDARSEFERALAEKQSSASYLALCINALERAEAGEPH